MKLGILNLERWAEKTAGAVRHVCLTKKAPCVGFALVFFDPLADEEERWNFSVELAYDPHDPPDEDSQKRLEQAFEYLSEGIKRIMSGDFEEDLRDYEIHGRLH